MDRESGMSAPPEERSRMPISSYEGKKAPEKLTFTPVEVPPMGGKFTLKAGTVVNSASENSPVRLGSDEEVTLEPDTGYGLVKAIVNYRVKYFVLAAGADLRVDYSKLDE